MKFKILVIAAAAALLGMNARAQWDDFSTPLAYVNISDSAGGAGVGGAYIQGQAIGVSDLQAITGNNLTFELLPNVLFYNAAVVSTNDADRVFWTNSEDLGLTAGPDGNKGVEHILYYENTIVPFGTTNVTMTYTVGLNDLSNRYQQVGYEPVANIKAFNQGFAGIAAEAKTILTNGLSGVVSLNLTSANWGKPLQAGFTFYGLNANPADDWGSLTVTVDSLLMDYLGESNTPPAAPTFTDGPSGISDQAIYMECSIVTDPTGVEYLFENITQSRNSGWRSDNFWLDQGAQLSGATGVVNQLTEPDFSPLTPAWEGWGTAPGGAVSPNTFVTVAAGEATVTPTQSAEFSFYYTFGAGGKPALVADQGYEFTFSSDNVSLPPGITAEAFVKGFNSGWGEDVGFVQFLPLNLDGSSQTISFTADAHDSTASYYQVGWRTVGATGTTYKVSNPTVFTVDNEFAGLPPESEFCYRVKARDLSPFVNESGYATTNCASTLVGDVTAPSPDPHTFADAGSGSPISAKMTATPATDTSPVEYYFENVSGPGNDSGWISTNVYIDFPIASAASVEYRVRARDLSFFGNTNGWSLANVTINTDPYPGSVNLSDPLNWGATVHEVFQSGLELANYNVAARKIGFEFFGSVFDPDGNSDGGRNIIRTLADNYELADLEVFVTSTYTTNIQQIFIGIGPGELGAFGVPDWSPNNETTNASFIVELKSTNMTVWSQEAALRTNDYSATATNTIALADGATVRIKLEYDSNAETCTVLVDENFGGIFTPDGIFGPYATPNFVGASKVYIGGDDGVTLKDLNIIVGAAKILEPTDLVIQSVTGDTATLQWTGLSAQTYTVIYKTDLTAGSWTVDGANQNIPGANGTMGTSSTVVGDEVFYQIQTQ